MKTRFVSVVAVSVAMIVSLAACSEERQADSAQQPDIGPVVDLLTLMDHIISPAAFAVWDWTGVVIDESGEHSRLPTTDEEWALVINGAAVLAESRNLTMIPGRVLDDTWAKYARELAEVGSVALEAAEAHDGQTLEDVSNRLVNVCNDCHDYYGVEM